MSNVNFTLCSAACPVAGMPLPLCAAVYSVAGMPLCLRPFSTNPIVVYHFVYFMYFLRVRSLSRVF
jgi:hypothetical protein